MSVSSEMAQFVNRAMLCSSYRRMYWLLLESTHHIDGNFMRFIVCDFVIWPNFTNFILFHRMFYPKTYKADFERNCQILTAKSLILNKIAKFYNNIIT